MLIRNGYMYNSILTFKHTLPTVFFYRHSLFNCPEALVRPHLDFFYLIFFIYNNLCHQWTKAA